MTNPCNLFKPGLFTVDLLAAHFPQGGVFDAVRRDESTFRNLLEGVSGEFLRLEQQVHDLCKELDPNSTRLLLEEWERSLGIPDDCIGISGTVEERRQAILLKLRGLRLQTADDFIELAAIFGKVIFIIPGAVPGSYPATYPTIYGGSEKARHTMIVVFPFEKNNVYNLAYPSPYGNTGGVVECLILNNRQSNVKVIFRYEGV